MNGRKTDIGTKSPVGVVLSVRSVRSREIGVVLPILVLVLGLALEPILTSHLVVIFTTLFNSLVESGTILTAEAVVLTTEAFSSSVVRARVTRYAIFGKLNVLRESEAHSGIHFE